MTESIVHKSLRDKIVETLKTEILQGRLEPAQRINFEQLAVEMNVSRTPLREALVSLENEGLVETIPRRGTFVRQVSTEEIAEIYELREVLEVYAVKSGAPNFSNELISRLEEICSEYEEAIADNNIHECIDRDLKLHRTIIEAAKNRKLSDIMGDFSLQVQAISLSGPNYLQYARRYSKEHREIVEAIRESDFERAAELVGLHISAGKELILRTRDKNGG